MHSRPSRTRRARLGLFVAAVLVAHGARPHVGAQVHLAGEWQRLLLSNANVVVLEGGFDAWQAQGSGEER